ncbi:serine/threonine-protein kinase [Nocardia thailandica]
MRDGASFAGYAIERRLGRGGMGAVYLARHPRLPRWTALKLLNEDLFSDHELRARFEREADLVARLDHPNIVTVFDRGAVDGRLWISMQYVDGIDAAAVDARTLPPDRAVQIVREIAEALDFAHGRGVLHRDVKPANILLERASDGRERVYLTDFGIARALGDAGRLTRTGSFTATLSYASPEQLTGAPMDGRSDQYSLACTLYWLLTGSVPFGSEHPALVIQGHLQHRPPPVSALRPGLPAGLDPVLERAMAKVPAERFASCAAFAAAARHALAAPPRPAPPSPTPPGPTPPGPTRAAPAGPIARAPRTRSSARLLAVAGIALVVVLGVGAGVWVSRGGTPFASPGKPTAPTADIEDVRAAFPRLLPDALSAEGVWWVGTGFEGMKCGGTSLTDKASRNTEVYWSRNEPHPDVGRPTTEWYCIHDPNVSVPPGQTRLPNLRIFRYESTAEVKRVIDGFADPTTETGDNAGTTYTTYRWGSTYDTYPRFVTAFPGDPRRERMLVYTNQCAHLKDECPSLDQLLAWWRTVPLS